LDVQTTSKEKNKEKRFWKETRILIKKIRHSKLPITLESSDNLNLNLLEAIEYQMSSTGWDRWTDEDGNWFNPYFKNTNQMELFV